MLTVSSIFQSGAVIQRDKPVAIWGSAGPGEKINVSIQGRSASASADEGGRWSVVIDPLAASEEETLTVDSGEERIVLTDVAVGEVWLAGGQSNMEFHMRYEKNLPDVKPVCADPRVRFYDVPEIAFEGQDECFDYSNMGRWRKSSPDDIEYFSAVGYYFEKELEQALDVPVGIIGCNWGGTVSASWMDPETVRRSGPAWMEEYEDFASKADMEEYLERQRNNMMNDRGKPFEDPFSEFMMPRTPGPEECQAFFADLMKLGMPLTPSQDEPLPSLIPGALYEHMLKTVAPYSIRGFLWYQGESDDERGHADLYEAMLTGLISDWRALWNDDDLPFLVVQLPGFGSWLMTVNQHFDLIRAAQEAVSERDPAVWLCSISDAGEELDIHPKNKKPVGERLALLARGHIYGEDILCDAPAAREARRSGNTIDIFFDHAEGGLVLEGESVNALSVKSGERDLGYTAEVIGDRLRIVPSGSPEEITISLANEAFYIVNLYNLAGIPAIPFRFTM